MGGKKWLQWHRTLGAVYRQ